MSKLYFSIVAMLLCSTIAKAQPTLNPINFSQFIGQHTTFYLNTSSALDTNTVFLTGANQTWDYSNLSGDTFALQYYGDMATMPQASLFPNANLGDSTVFPNGTVQYGYYEYNNTYLTSWGFKGINEIEYIDPIDNYPFPYNFQDVWVDSFNSVSEGPGVETITYDAHGTLISPLGTFPNLIRMKVETYTQSTNTYSTEYHWIDPFTGFLHFVVVGNNALWIDQSMVTNIIDESAPNDPLARVYPTIGDGLYQLENLTSTEVELMVLDITGKVISSTSINTALHQIDLTQEQSGVYILLLANKEGQTNTLKIVKQ